MRNWKKAIKIAMTGLLGLSIMCSLTMQEDSVFAKQKKKEVLVDSTVKPKTEVELKHTNDTITVNGTKVDFAEEIKLVDKNADSNTIGTYLYLKAIGESEAVLYGHMEDTVLKAGSGKYTYSDTEDMTGSISAIDGLDCGNLFAGFAEKCNRRYKTSFSDTNEGNLDAAAYLSNESIKKGAILTLSSHMPNFAKTVKKEGVSKHSYDQYDYSGGDSYNLTGDCINEILPGGLYHKEYNAYLDFIADYCSKVEGTILFRPFHENTGSWFWWGKAFCDPSTYQNVYRYTVEYLRDTKGIHNILYLYGPGSEASSLTEYEERYPGDAYVDMIGFDCYDSNPVSDEEGYTFWTNFESMTRLADEFAKKHQKLFAVTETGMSSSSGGILESGNKRKDWYVEILDILTKPEYDCCYFMLWSNYSREGSYYTPFIVEKNEDGTYHGHELLDCFIEMYNRSQSVFALDQIAVIKDINAGKIAASQVKGYDELSGYITAPIANKFLVEKTELKANVNKKVSEAEFRVVGKEEEIVIPGNIEGTQVTATLTQENLKRLKETADGKIELYADGKKLASIHALLNVSVPEMKQGVVDNFENYFGLDTLLNGSWAINKDSGCELNLSSTKEKTKDGSYALRFEYKETKNGWAGAVYSKTVDYSSYNALQLWVIPDGKNQKTVVQINTADGGSYEAYLNTYEEYADKKISQSL